MTNLEHMTAEDLLDYYNEIAFKIGADKRHARFPDKATALKRVRGLLVQADSMKPAARDPGPGLRAVLCAGSTWNTFRLADVEREVRAFGLKLKSALPSLERAIAAHYVEEGPRGTYHLTVGGAKAAKRLRAEPTPTVVGG